jgi:hypothetical protein
MTEGSIGSRLFIFFRCLLVAAELAPLKQSSLRQYRRKKIAGLTNIPSLQYIGAVIE